MQVAKDIKLFTGSMDGDNNARMMLPNDYRIALNKRNGITGQSNNGAAENVLGTLQLDNAYLPTGRNVCITNPAYEDLRDNSIIFANWNENGFHGWYRWYANKTPYENGVIEPIYIVANPSAYDKFNPNPLDFQEDNKITGVNLVDDVLYWTVDNTQPKQLDCTLTNSILKRRAFNFYFYQDSLPYITRYDFLISSTAKPSAITIFSIDLQETTYTDRANEALTKLQLIPNIQGNFNVITKGQYIYIEALFEGDCFIRIYEYRPSTPLDVRDSIIVADNFYPDYRSPLAAQSWRALEQWHTNVIKSPPECKPTAEYITSEIVKGEKELWAQIEPVPSTTAAVPFTTFTFDTKVSYLALGANDDSTPPYFDTDSQYTLGTFTFSQQYAPTFPYVGGGVSYFTPYIPSGATQRSFKFTVTLSLLIQSSYTLGSQRPSFHLYDTIGNNVLFSYDFVFNGLNEVDFNGTIEGTLGSLAGTEHIVPLIVLYPTQYIPFGAPKTITYQIFSGSIQFSTEDTSYPMDYGKSYIFRARYIYKNNEQSVYGAVSVTPKPITYNETAIQIDFSDDRLSDPSYLFLIKSVILALSEDDGTTWYDFKTLEPSEFAGEGNKIYIFDGDETLIPSLPADIVLPYHSVPLTAKSQEYIDERIWYGGIKEGYDEVPIDINLDVEYLDKDDYFAYPTTEIHDEADTTHSYGSFWKRGWTGYIGIVYFDDYDRKSFVCISDQSKINVLFWNEAYPDRGSIATGELPIIGWEINHAPPEWATKYQWVRTKNLQHGEYLMWDAGGDGCMYVNDAFEDDSVSVAPVTPSNAAYIRIDISTIADYNAVGAKLQLTVIEGYVVRFTTSPIYKEFVIKKVTDTYIYIENDINFSLPYYNGTIVGYDRSPCEIFAPRTASIDNFFYEFGECYEVGTMVQNGVTVKYHKGQTQDQSFGTTPLNSVVPASGSFSWGTGNTWYRYMVRKPVAFPYDFMVCRSNREDDILTNSSNDGRVSVTSLIGERKRPTAIRFSDQFISNTEVNGLNAFQPLNEVQYNTSYGQVNKMQVINNDILKLIFGNSYQLEIYVNQGLIRQGQGNGNLISVATEVAGNSHIIQRTLGTVNPESVVINDEGDCMGWDGREGVEWRASGNGLIQISDYKQKITFRDIANKRNSLDLNKSFTPAIYDLYHDEYIQTFNSMTARETRLPQAEIRMFDIALPTTIDSVVQNIIGTSNGNQLFLLNQSTTDFPDISAMIVAGVNSNGLSMTATQEDGIVTIVAPVPYSLKNISIAVTYLDATLSINTKYYNFSFDEGWEGDQNDVAGFSGRTIAFNKQKNGWTTYYSFLPEAYGRLRNQIVSFVNGVLHLHDKGTAYNTFYGVQYNSSIKTIFVGDDAKKVKVIKGVWFKGRGKQNAVVTINPFDGASAGMRTEIHEDNFRLIEGGYYSDVQRDQYTPNFASAALAQINGRLIRGETGEVELVDDSNEFNVLYLAEVLYFYSENS